MLRLLPLLIALFPVIFLAVQNLVLNPDGGGLCGLPGMYTIFQISASIDPAMPRNGDQWAATQASMPWLTSPLELQRDLMTFMGLLLAEMAIFYRLDANVAIERLTIHDVPVRKYALAQNAESPTPNPAVVYIHGGGWVYGQELDPILILNLAQQGFTVFYPDYRLAPEHPYPAPLEDNLAVVQHVLSAEHAATYNIDNSRVAVMGDSAGGNMATSISLKLRQETEKPKLQVIMYPPLQAINFQTTSYQIYPSDSIRNIAFFFLTYMGLYDDTDTLAPQLVANQQTSAEYKQATFSNIFLSTDTINEGSYYVPENFVEGEVDFGDADLFAQLSEAGLTNPEIAPLLAESFEGVPQALVMTAEFDGGRDDGLAYIERMKADGVSVEHYHSKNGWHALMQFLALPGPMNMKCADDMLGAAIQYLMINL